MRANDGWVVKDAPYAPPIVALSDTAVGHLLAWELTEVDGSWWAWVSWIQDSGGRALHKVVQVRASGLQPLEARHLKATTRYPDAFAAATA